MDRTHIKMVLVVGMKQVHLTASHCNFVVKKSNHNSNQLPDDEGLQHCNRVGKITAASSFIGIARNISALDISGNDNEQSHKDRVSEY